MAWKWNELILLTSTVISSSNEDSDFLAINNKLRHAKSIEENEKLPFLSTIDWTIWCELLYK